MDVQRLRLGKLAPRDDHRTLKLEKYLLPGLLPAIPALCDWTGAVSDWGMDGNDANGDCTIAAADHLIRLWSATNGLPQRVSDDVILQTYYMLTGGPDVGLVEIDVLNYWRNEGIGGHKIDAFADPSIHNLPHVEASVYLFGGCYLGVSLPIRAQQQLQAGLPWDVGHQGFFGRVRGVDQPGSWGGHAIPIVAYDQQHQMFTCITWGRKQLLTYRWFQTYCDEAHTPLSQLWIGPKGLSPSLVDLPTLQADVAAVAA